MKLILWIQVEIVYNESIPTVLIEGLERFAQKQKAMTSCQHHLSQHDPESTTAFSLPPPPPPRPVIFIVAAPAVVAVAVNLQPRKKRLNLQQMIHTCN